MEVLYANALIYVVFSVSRSLLLGACNSHNKPMQRHVYSNSLFLDIFPEK